MQVRITDLDGSGIKQRNSAVQEAVDLEIDVQKID